MNFLYPSWNWSSKATFLKSEALLKHVFVYIKWTTALKLERWNMLELDWFDAHAFEEDFGGF